MSKSFTLLAVCLVCACAFGQSFECYPVGPLPTDPSFGPEGVVSNNLGFVQFPQLGTGVSNTVSCGFPVTGTKYLSLTANGPGFQPPTNVAFLPPVGGPFPRPIPALVTEARIPIPAGSTQISMIWEFFNRECSTTAYYDGMSIDVVDTGGNLVQNLLYVDTLSAEGSCSIGTDYCSGQMAETVPAGPNTLASALPALAGCEYISIAIWNGNDNSFPSVAYFDNIQFSSTNAACPVPCFVGPPGPPALAFCSTATSCVQVNLIDLPAGGFYFMAATLQAGAYPNGWFFGVDISFPELQNEINTGFPFLGGVSTSACSGTTGSAQIGPFCGIPSGLTFYAVAVGAPFGSSYPTAITNAVSHTVP